MRKDSLSREDMKKINSRVVGIENNIFDHDIPEDAVYAVHK